MMLIPCPHCGPRDEGEFTYGGPQRPFPELDGQAGTNDWHEPLCHPLNPRGAVLEIWYHTSGCERWIEVTRDTCTHQITDCAVPGSLGKNP